MHYIVGLSARSRDGLHRTACRLAQVLAGAPSTALTDVVTTLATGRPNLPVRGAWLVEDLPQLATALSTGTPAYQGRAEEPPAVRWLADEYPAVDAATLARLADSDAAVATAVATAPVDQRWPVAQDAVWRRLRQLGMPATQPDEPGLRVGIGRADADIDVAADGLIPGTVAALWCAGVPMDLTLGRSGRRIHLPGPAYERAAQPDWQPDGRPLTAHEQRLLYHDLVRTSSSAEHNVAATGVVDAAIAPAALTDTLRAVLADHEQLRTMYRRAGDRWEAVVVDAPAIVVEVVDRDASAAAPGDDLPLTDRVPLRALAAPGETGGTELTLVAYRALTDEAGLRATLSDWQAALTS